LAPRDEKQSQPTPYRTVSLRRDAYRTVSPKKQQHRTMLSLQSIPNSSHRTVSAFGDGARAAEPSVVLLPNIINQSPSPSPPRGEDAKSNWNQT